MARTVAFVAHALAIVASIMVLFWSISYRGGFSWESSNKSLILNLHPVLMHIGLVILGGQAIISHKSLPFEREMKKKIHFGLHVIALIFGILGIFVVVKNQTESNIPNFYILHSLIGYGVILLYATLLKLSVVVLLQDQSSNECSGFLTWHVSISLYTFVLAVGNSVLGFVEKLAYIENSGLEKYESEVFLVNLIAIISILFGTFVILTVSTKSPPYSDEDNDHSYLAI